MNQAFFRQMTKAALIVLLILLGLSLTTNLFLRDAGLEPFSGKLIQFDQSLEVDYHTRYGELAQDFNAALAPRDLMQVQTRNIFEMYRSVEDLLVLVDIRLEPLALVYKGRIARRDGSLVAQVNWGERTHFVREGESIDGWRIIEIAAGQLRVKNAEGEELTLPYLETTYRKERSAVLYHFLKQEEIVVRLGDRVEGLTVANITENSIALSGLSGKDPLTLTKRGASS